MNPPGESQWLTPARLRFVLDIGESTEAAWREAKLISYFRQGRLVRYDPAAVLEFIARHTVKARGMQNAEGRRQNEEWLRIERLIADQVRVQVRSALAERKLLEAA